jgi:hypothetical protein
MTMTTTAPVPARRGPYCKALSRGSLGEVDGRSKEGKFLRRIEGELVAQLGGEPSFAQRLLIRRAARSLLQLELLDEKLSTGSWTAHDCRTQGGLNNAVRLALRELGLNATPARAPTLADYLANLPADDAL